MPLVSKNGTDFFEIEDDENEMRIAESKGYKPYMEVTKNGKDVFKIEANADEINTAMNKGYLEKKAFERSKKSSNIPKWQSSMQGAADVMSWDLNDEIIGAASGVKNVLQGEDFGKGYKQSRDLIREQKKRLEEANPEYYLGGQLAGAVASPSFAAKGASMLGRIGKGAAEGALQAFGGSEDPQKLIQDMASGGATSAAIISALEGLGYTGKALKAAKKLIPGTEGANPAVNKLVSKMASAVPSTSASAEDINEILSNTNLRRNLAKQGSMKDLAGAIEGSVKKSKEGIGSIYGEAKKGFLAQDPGDFVPVINDLNDALKSGEKLSSVLSKEAKDAIDTVDSIVFKGINFGEMGAESFGKNVTADTVKERLIKARRNIDDLLFKGKTQKINLTPEDYEYTRGLRKKLNDSIEALPGAEDFRKADELYSKFSGAKDEFLGPITTKGKIDRTKLSNLLRNQGERGSVFEESAKDFKDFIAKTAKEYGISSKASDDAVNAIEELRKIASDKRFLDNMKYGFGGPTGLGVRALTNSMAALATGGVSLVTMPITDPSGWARIVDTFANVSGSPAATYIRQQLNKISKFAKQLGTKSARVTPSQED